MRLRDPGGRNVDHGDAPMINVPRHSREALIAALAVVGLFTVDGAAAPGGLTLRIRPLAPVYHVGENISLEFSLKNDSSQMMLATKTALLHELTYLDVITEAGRRVGWKGRLSEKQYSQDAFVILRPGQAVVFQAVICYAGGEGYRMQKVGTYRVQAEFSLSPREYFAPVAKGAVIPETPAISNWATIVVRAKKRDKADEK